jgi:hypothetical protein
MLDKKYKIKQKFSHKRYHKYVRFNTKTLKREKGYISFYTYQTKKIGGVKVRATLKYYISDKDELFSEYGSFSKLKRSGKYINAYFNCRREKIITRDAPWGYSLIGRFWGRTFYPDEHGGRGGR